MGVTYKTLIREVIAAYKAQITEKDLNQYLRDNYHLIQDEYMITGSLMKANFLEICRELNVTPSDDLLKEITDRDEDKDVSLEDWTSFPYKTNKKE